MVKKHFPHLKLFIRARNRYDAYELLDHGVENIYRESLDTSVRLATEVLQEMGFRKYTLQRMANQFIKIDESSMKELAQDRHDEKHYVTTVKTLIQEEEAMLHSDLKRLLVHDDHAWETEKRNKNERKKATT